jgi:hypothetical protein
MDHEMNQRLHERDVRILAAKHSDDALIRAVFVLDLALRRAAWRLLGLSGL